LWKRVAKTSRKIRQRIDLTDTVRAFLDNEEIENELPRGYSGRVTDAYKAMLAQRDDGTELAAEYHAAFYTRRLTLKRLRKRPEQSVLEAIATEMK